MMQSMYTAKLGISSQQTRIDTIANNLANVNTVGFKASTVNFKDALYTTMARPVQPQDDLNMQKGTGTLVGSVVRDFSQGVLTNTGNSMDWVIDGEGFFSVENDQGELMYTRNGMMALSTEADGNYLVTSQGYYVLDVNGQRIQVPGDGSDISIATNGELSIGTNAPFAQLNIVFFDNAEGLLAAGDNAFVPSEASGEPLPDTASTVLQGYYEGSNVDMAKELTTLIRAQRVFSLSGKALTTADEMEGLANQMRR